MDERLGRSSLILAHTRRYGLGMHLPWPVVLASASPRRQDLLRRIVPGFSIDAADVDESPLQDELPWQTAERLAILKARAVFKRHSGSLVIAGDTVVAAPEKGSYVQLAKPEDETHAFQMLSRLSGRKHLVITGVCIMGPRITRSFGVTTTVGFRDLTEEEMLDYVATGEPMDKAGAYAIQGGAAKFVTECLGSTTNVIGFPLEEI